MRQDHRLMHTPANRAVGGRRIAPALGLGVVLMSILLRGLAQQDDMHVAKRIPPILSTGMGVSETHPYRYETLYDGTVTASLATPIRRDDDQLVATMIDVLRGVFAIPSGTDLSVSMEHFEETDSWRFSDERYVYWVEPLSVVGQQLEGFSLRRQSRP